MRKHMYWLLVVIMLPLFSTTVFANSKKQARISQSSISLDGQAIRATGFNVSNNNYFKLRDIANSLSGTTSQFEVAWNQDKGLIEIMTRAPYTPSDGESSRRYYPGNTYYGALGQTKLLVDGKEHILSVFKIHNSNYFKLRDLSKLIGFDMAWDAEKEEILIFSQLADNAYRVESNHANNDNTLYPYFPRWRDTVRSYMIENKDGTISVINGNKDVTIETYDSHYTLLSQNKIPYELPLFGGFYGGKDYHYIAFGQSNEGENNSQEVIRIVRYDKNFKPIDSVSVKGGESYTVVPFSSAAGRMAQAGDELVFHTSRKRYKTSDGLNHQSQLTMIIDTQTMQVTNDLGRFQKNHVSHSFDQYVLFDNNDHVLLDHGDAYPRSIVLSKESGGDYKEVDLFNIPGAIGANCTGVSIGGFEASSSHYIALMNTIDHSLVKEYTSFHMVGLERDQRDIIISVVPKNNLTNHAVEQITLKQYTGTNKNGSIPHLVKITDNQFMAMWQEYDQLDRVGDLQYVMIDGQGKLASEIKSIKHFKLSTNQPVLIGGKVTWYVDTKGMRTFYTIPL